MYRYGWTNHARQQLKKLDSETQRAIIKKLDYFLTTPNPLSYAKRLTNLEVGQYRLRIGDHRVIFDLVEHTIVILSVGHRREIYNK